MSRIRISRSAVVLGMLSFLMGACSPISAGQTLQKMTPTVIQPNPTTAATAAPTATMAPTADPGYTLWVSSAVPDGLRKTITLPPQVSVIDFAVPDSFRLEPVSADVTGRSQVSSAAWVYALVAPFPTITDQVSLADLKDAWQGKPGVVFTAHPILVDPSTKAAIETLFGTAAGGGVHVMPGDQILETAWQDMTSWAIVPFESLAPRWKVLRVDGSSPYDKKFDAALYALTVHFSLDGPMERAAAFQAAAGLARPLGLAATNRDPDKLTVVVMTGVTALVRSTANKMDTKGITYPGRDIGDWLRDADIAHVSNEVSFDPNCPPGNPNQTSLQFCSRPEYIGLLDDVGVDVVELSGNHLNDWSRKALMYTLDLYDQHHIQYFAGGRNIEEARKALLIENHGNKIAFIGCNPPGPDFDWATDTGAGAAPCDLDWEAGEISRLRAEGYLPIATFQYNESYGYLPGAWQIRDFRKMSAAGAVVVSGSQAHFPQTFEFDQGNLIHYGLGNLFFDQMAPIIDGVRIHGTEREFLDRHIFYDGRYLGTDLLTAMLEDYAKPRPMTADERGSLLQDVFKASGWLK
ncbi:MAG TPA: CapA family protein [Anaerolineaceae bacterium]